MARYSISSFKSLESKAFEMSIVKSFGFIYLGYKYCVEIRHCSNINIRSSYCEPRLRGLNCTILKCSNSRETSTEIQQKQNIHICIVFDYALWLWKRTAVNITQMRCITNFHFFRFLREFLVFLHSNYRSCFARKCITLMNKHCDKN